MPGEASNVGPLRPRETQEQSIAHLKLRRDRLENQKAAINAELKTIKELLKIVENPSD